MTDNAQAVAAVRLPSKFMVSIGGFAGSHYEVRWQRGWLQYHTDDSQTTVTPAAEAWETFWTAMDQIGIWEWRQQYDDPETLDGTQWSIEISDGARSVRSFGSNRYPREFHAFFQTVSALTRRPLGR